MAYEYKMVREVAEEVGSLGHPDDQGRRLLVDPATQLGNPINHSPAEEYAPKQRVAKGAGGNVPSAPRRVTAPKACR